MSVLKKFTFSLFSTFNCKIIRQMLYYYNCIHHSFDFYFWNWRVLISDIPYYSPKNFHLSPLIYSNLLSFYPSLVQAWASCSYPASEGRSMSTSPSSSLFILPHLALCLLPQRAAPLPTLIPNRHRELGDLSVSAVFWFWWVTGERVSSQTRSETGNRTMWHSIFSRK